MFFLKQVSEFFDVVNVADFENSDTEAVVTDAWLSSDINPFRTMTAF